MPIFLGSEPLRRGTSQQEHADTGNSIWDGAVALAKALERQPKLVRGLRVLELGSGRGVAGLAAWLLGAETLLTDLEYTLEALRKAVELTRRAAGPKELKGLEVLQLDWLKIEEFLQERRFSL